jgi:hypothetical protein
VVPVRTHRACSLGEVPDLVCGARLVRACLVGALQVLVSAAAQLVGAGVARARVAFPGPTLTASSADFSRELPGTSGTSAAHEVDRYDGQNGQSQDDDGVHFIARVRL